MKDLSAKDRYTVNVITPMNVRPLLYFNGSYSRFQSFDFEKQISKSYLRPLRATCYPCETRPNSWTELFGISSRKKGNTISAARLSSPLPRRSETAPELAGSDESERASLGGMRASPNCPWSPIRDISVADSRRGESPLGDHKPRRAPTLGGPEAPCKRKCRILDAGETGKQDNYHDFE